MLAVLELQTSHSYMRAYVARILDPRFQLASACGMLHFAIEAC